MRIGWGVEACGIDGAVESSGGSGFFFQAEDGIRDRLVTGVQTCALPISHGRIQLYRGGSTLFRGGMALSRWRDTLPW